MINQKRADIYLLVENFVFTKHRPCPAIIQLHKSIFVDSFNLFMRQCLTIQQCPSGCQNYHIRVFFVN